MIDIKLLRNPQTYAQILQSEKNRFKSTKNVEKAYELDKQRIKIMFEKEQVQKEINKLKNEIKKNKNEESVKMLKNLKVKKSEFEKELKKVEEEFHFYFKQIGNVLDESVPVRENEDEVFIVREYEKKEEKIREPLEKTFKEALDVKETKNNLKINKNKYPFPFHTIMEKIHGIDMKRGTKISGHRGYFLIEELALLENALERYAIDFLRKAEYKLLQVPLILKKDVLRKTVQINEFEDQIYETKEGFLIATSEQSISTMFMDERLKESDLPLKYCGQSVCFRREAGAAGKDNKGIFRVHQFNKIEQFVICSPKESNSMFEKMVQLSEEFFKSLGIPYRVIKIVSGSMNDSAALKYDIECYFPHKGEYRELVSVSNCTDYQSRDLEVRMGHVKENGEKKYVHMLNGTLCAVQRSLCCLVENWQCEGGVWVPDVLRAYYGEHFIPYKE